MPAVPSGKNAGQTVPPRLLTHLRGSSPGGLLGVYMYGSTVLGGARHDSDLDLLMLTEHSLDHRERLALVTLLLELSGWKGHADRHPEATGRRPIELTSIVVGRHHPASPGRGRDLQFGEWRRDEILTRAPDIDPPGPEDDPDTVVLAQHALTANRVLLGPPLEHLLLPIAPAELRTALRAGIPDLLSGLVGDERNVLLTLARMLVTLETGEIVPKDTAADLVAPLLDPGSRELLLRAREGYLGRLRDDWSNEEETADIGDLAHRLATRAMNASPPSPSAMP